MDIKTCLRIISRNNFALPYVRHNDRTRRKDLTNLDNIEKLWETDIHYVDTVKEGMYYLMSIKDCYSKKLISYVFLKTCTTKDFIRVVEKAY